MAGLDYEPTLADILREDQASNPLHNLYSQADYFLRRDWNNPKRLRFAYGLGVASIGQEVEGSHYRLTDMYSHEGFAVHVPGLVAVEQVPGEAVTTAWREKVAIDRADNQRLWRLRPSRIAYALGGFDDVFSAAIEDLAAMPLESRDCSQWNKPRRIEHHLPHKTFKYELESDRLERAQHIITELLGKLDITVK